MKTQNRPWIVLKFPEQCKNDLQCYRRVINDYWKSIDATDQDVLFDCGDVCFIRPLGGNILALLIRGFLQQGSRKVFLTDPNNGYCKKYLADQGFYKEFHVENNVVASASRRTSVGLRWIQSFDPLYLDEIARWLNRNSMLPQNIIDDAVKITLTEVILNVIDHSQSSIGCYVSAQAYPHEQRLMLSVADLGIGFFATLGNRYNLENNEQAIELAVQSGVSSKSRGRNAGAGLDVLRVYLKHSGALEIISKDGRWRQKPDGTTLKETLPFSFPGTCINVEFDNRKILDWAYE